MHTDPEILQKIASSFAKAMEDGEGREGDSIPENRLGALCGLGVKYFLQKVTKVTKRPVWA